MKSKAVVLHADTMPMEGIVDPGPHQIYRNSRIAVENRELTNLNSEEIRMEMIYGGLCGTDVHLVESHPETGYVCSSAPTTIPAEGRIIGHEGVGRVIEIGSHVRHVKPGAYVTFESIIVCHHCDVCRRGYFNQCRQATLLGMEKDGLFGTFVDVPSMLAHDVTEMIKSDKGLKAAACVEPAGVAYVACQNTRITGGDVVTVFGAGPIGIFSAIFSKIIFGAAEVHIVDPVKFRREFARQWLKNVYDVDDYFDNHSHDVDVVIEASGKLDNVTKVFRRLNANGRVALLARSGNSLTLNDVDHMITNQVCLVGSRGHLGGAFNNILNLYKQGRIPLDEIVTQVVNGPEGLCDLLKSKKKILNENCKVLVRFGTDGTTLSHKERIE